jgi:hypothetical protein
MTEYVQLDAKMAGKNGTFWLYGNVEGNPADWLKLIASMLHKPIEDHQRVNKHHKSVINYINS